MAALTRPSFDTWISARDARVALARAVQAVPVRPVVTAPVNPVPTVQPRGAVARPSFADAIDAMVSELVAKGDVVFDAETDAYRAPHYRRFRFG